MSLLYLRNTIHSLPASIYCLSIVGAGWLAFALTREEEPVLVIAMENNERLMHLGCSVGTSMSWYGQAASEKNLTQIKQNSGASSLRVLSDIGLRNLSFTPERLSVEVDSVGRITRSFCG